MNCKTVAAGYNRCKGGVITHWVFCLFEGWGAWGEGLSHIQYLYQNLFFVKRISFLYIILYKCITISK
jgi:hypothetical protein